MPGDKTFCIIKPDAVAADNAGQIIAMLTQEGFSLCAMKMTMLDRAGAERFYAAHRGKDFFGPLIEFMTSGPVVAIILRGYNAVERLRALAGATNPSQAAPDTIRHRFGSSVTRNAIHASDSDQNAWIEWRQFFGPDEIF